MNERSRCLPSIRMSFAPSITRTGTERNKFTATVFIVIIDSRVRIQEMAEIGGLTAKLDAIDVRYYVYNPAYPKLGMSEIVWRTKTLPLPGIPPPTE